MIYTGKVKKVGIYINSSYLRLTDIKAKTGCDLIFNGGIYDMRSFEPHCHLKVDGKIITADEYSYWGYGWNTNDVALMADYSKVSNYIACVCLIRNGKPERLIYNADMGGARERTAWGIKKDGTHVFYVDKSPKTPEALQIYMIAQGCDSALMFDGGGSTQGIFPNGEVYSGRIVTHVICVWLDKAEDNPDAGDLIIEPDYEWKQPLVKRSRTDFIILHHAAADGSAEDIHNYHSQRPGWAGIGYNYYIRKDGNIYRGRPENTIGAHTEGYNSRSIGICFEGNFETDNMGEAQFAAGVTLIKDILTRYPAQIKGHKDFALTACPGKNFPMAKIIDAVQGSSKPSESVSGEGIKLPTLRVRSSGRSVQALQILLNGYGHNSGVADGIFGAKTEAAVKSFQKKHGLTVDGIVGKNTWQMLLIE